MIREPQPSPFDRGSAMGSARGEAREAQRVASKLGHPAMILARRSLPLAEARLNDRQRLAVLLQGAALHSHLSHAGWRLTAGWSGVGVDENGLLRGVGAEPGRDRVPVQSHLAALALALFGASTTVAGRGQARKVIRARLEQWQQELERADPDEEVARILDEAPFLWEDAFALARRALAAELVFGERRALWLAGPRRWRTGLLRIAEGRLAALHERLASASARDYWNGEPAQLPTELVRQGHWLAALRAFEARAPQRDERVARVECLIATGRFERALVALARGGSQAERILKVECQYQLGRFGAALRGLLRLEREKLSPDAELRLAETALRLYANRGDDTGSREWSARCRRCARGERAARAHLLMAFGCWDRLDSKGMARHLEAARAVAEDPLLAWQFHQARALWESRWGDRRAALELIERALRGSRRRMRRADAGRLWTDVVLMRVLNDDLGGAERACRFSLRLFGGCEGPAKTTLALYNLAELQIRRGRFGRVEEILARSRRENHFADNLRGGAHDAELLARLALSRGRLEEAIEIATDALEALTRGGLDWNREELTVLSARALGWLGREQRAAQLLSGLGARDLLFFEPEERPFLFAHAGMPEPALELASGFRGASLVAAALRDRPLAQAEWEAELEGLEPYRAARLVFDLALLRPEAVPSSWRRRAAAILRRAGAGELAERLEVASASLFWAVARGLEKPGPEAARAMLDAAGHGGATLMVSEGPLHDERCVLRGEGGVYRAMLHRGGRTWRLETASADERLEALAGLAGLICEAEGSGTRGRVNGHPPARIAANGIVGESEPLSRVLRRLELLGRQELPMLILGETGTGKELAARMAHDVSSRKAAAFLALNCAAMSETLGLSDLFGHARGAFTGADRDRAGVFESARGGTVFLDEIGDLPLGAQGMLLRVLQEGEIRRLGESQPRKVDVRVVAATHRDLLGMVADRTFREDLYYRLGVGQVIMPPLRERGTDIVLLARHFLTELGGGPLIDSALRRLTAHSWPGNVRQLRSVLTGAVALAGPGEAIAEEHLELPAPLAEAASTYHEWLEQLKRQRIRRELEASGGNQSEAARRLGLSRQALSYLVRQLGLS
jgi:transcriptional regulator with AAA-type ATPase domain